MAKNRRLVSFKNIDNSVAFIIADGGSVYIGGKECAVMYINEDFFIVGMKCYSYDEFMRIVVLCGQSVAPGRGVVSIP